MANLLCPHCGTENAIPPSASGLVACGRCGNQFLAGPPQPPLPLIVTEPRQPIPARHRPAKSRRAIPYAWIVPGIGVICVSLALFAANRPATKPPTPRSAARSQSAPQPSRMEAEQEKLREARQMDAMVRAMDVAFVDAGMLASEFSLNALAAGKKYEGRMVRVRGTVLAVTRNSDALPLVVLRTDSVWMVRVFIAKGQFDNVAKFFPGDDVMLLGAYTGVQGTVIDVAGGVVCDESLEQWLKSAKR
jgi:putative nucleic acid binding protein